MVSLYLFALLPSGILNECLFQILIVCPCLCFTFSSKIWPKLRARVLSVCGWQICLSLLFVHVLGFLFGGRIRPSADLEERFLFRPFWMARLSSRFLGRAERIRLFGYMTRIGVIHPRRELPIASWVFCPTGTSTVELDRGVHVGHYRLFLFC